MKKTSDNSLLDNFLGRSLKELDIQYQQSDWSEMEPMLGSVHKPISLDISKKTIIISASALAIIIISIIISQTVNFSSSSPEEASPQSGDSSQSLLNAANMQDTITVHALIPAADSAKSDSAADLKENKNADSVKITSPPDTASAKKKNDKNKKEKVKQNSTDTTQKTEIPLTPIVDTASKPEIKINAPPAADTAKPIAAPVPKPKKNKKQKNAARDSSKAKTETLPPAQPDSLKQQ